MSTRRGFLAAQIAGLEPFGFLAVAPAGGGGGVTVRRDGDGRWGVEIDGAAGGLTEGQQASLVELGLA
ncbi:MAG: hypothetical protein ACRD0F_07895, partial [Acidimicrobiales bacterium]